MTLKRCPFCGSSEVEVDCGEFCGSVVCHTCDASGPIVSVEAPLAHTDYDTAKVVMAEEWNRRPDLGPDTELEPRTPPGGDRTQKGDNRKGKSNNRKGEKDGDSN